MCWTPTPSSSPTTATRRGIAGIMGGKDTGSFDDTMNVFIESAWFDPARIARAGRKQGIISDARYRFERGVDPQFVLPGLELCHPADPGMVRRRGLRCGDRRRTAAAAQADRVRSRRWSRAWAASSCRARRSSPFCKTWASWSKITAPCMWCRRAGAMTSTAPPTWWKKWCAFTAWPMCRRCRCRAINAVAAPVLSKAQRRTRAARRAIAARGFNECVSFSFIARDQAKLFGGGDDARQLSNPIASDLDALRPSILPSLLAAACAQCRARLCQPATVRDRRRLRQRHAGSAEDRRRRHPHRPCRAPLAEGRATTPACSP